MAMTSSAAQREYDRIEVLIEDFIRQKDQERPTARDDRQLALVGNAHMRLYALRTLGDLSPEQVFAIFNLLKAVWDLCREDPEPEEA